MGELGKENQGGNTANAKVERLTLKVVSQVGRATQDRTAREAGAGSGSGSGRGRVDPRILPHDPTEVTLVRLSPSRHVSP